MDKKEVVIYQAKTGAIEFKGDIDNETVWASQAQIAKAFGVTSQNVTIHIKNIYKDKELLEKSTCKESLQVQIEGKRKIKRKIKEYNLDIIIAVGYRINSVLGTKFRQWATKTLKDHLIKGYTINRKRISKNYEQFLKSVEDVKKLLPRDGTVSSGDTLELIKFFAGTRLSLDAYDKENFSKKGLTKKQVKITADELRGEILKLKTELISKNETTEIFAQER